MKPYRKGAVGGNSVQEPSGWKSLEAIEQEVVRGVGRSRDAGEVGGVCVQKDHEHRIESVLQRTSLCQP
jgi:hypothetical protein